MAEHAVAGVTKKAGALSHSDRTDSTQDRRAQPTVAPTVMHHAPGKHTDVKSDRGTFKHRNHR